MNIWEIISSALLLISSILLIIVVLSQHGRDAYLGGAIAGGAAESFLGKGKAKSFDRLAIRFTRILAIIFVALTLVAGIITTIMK